MKTALRPAALLFDDHRDAAMTSLSSEGEPQTCARKTRRKARAATHVDARLRPGALRVLRGVTGGVKDHAGDNSRGTDGYKDLLQRLVAQAVRLRLNVEGDGVGG